MSALQDRLDQLPRRERARLLAEADRTLAAIVARHRQAADADRLRALFGAPPRTEAAR